MTRQSILMAGGTGNRYSAITIGKVAKVYPEANMVDVYLFDGTILDRTQVITGACSNRFGTMAMSVPENENPLAENPLFALQSRPPETDVYAVVAFVNDSLAKPICLGFLFPEENEVLCNKKQEGNANGAMFLWKHFSNVYTRVAEEGDIEISHPSGVLIKIGKNTTRTVINNYDGLIRPFKWKDRTNEELSPAPFIYIEHPSGTKITIDPEGNVEEIIVGNMTRTIKGNLIDNVEGDAQISIKGSASVSVGGNQTTTVSGIMTDTALQIEHN